MTAYFHSLVDIIALHPHWAGVAAFLAALAEGIVVIGSLVPGATLIVGLGALVGYGQLALWPLILWAAAGALAGDGGSYWLGRTFDGRIRRVWPFATRPQLIAGGEAFFRRHGGWSVLLGRFIPPARAVVPVVAGLLGLAPGRFFAASAFSALLWATTHVLTGLIASYALIGLGTVSNRLVVAIVIFAVGLVVVIALARLGIGLGLRALPHGRAALLAWAHGRGGRVAHFMERTLAPEHSEFRAFVILNALLVAAFAGFAELLEEVASKEAVVAFDHAISQFVQTLRTGWTDQVMLVPTMLGDWPVTTAVAVAGCCVLAGFRRYRLAGGLAVALISTMIFVQVMKRLVQASRPLDLYAGTDAFSFPSGHATMTATLYGLVGLIAFRGLRGAAGRVAMGGCAAIIAAVALSRVYLGAHWPSDVAAGMLFGTGMTAGFALIFRRDEIPRQVAAAFLATILASLVLVGAWHIDRGFARGLAFYAPQPVAPASMAGPWRAGGWQDLPAYRIDIAGEFEEPLILQWQGTADELAADLTRLGWSVAPPWSPAIVSRFADPNEEASLLPVLSKFHDGASEVLAMIRPGMLGGIEGRFVLRAWQRAIKTPDGRDATMLVASMTFERVSHLLGELSLPLTVAEVGCDADPLLSGLSHAMAVGAARAARAGGCGGRLVLAAP